MDAPIIILIAVLTVAVLITTYALIQTNRALKDEKRRRERASIIGYEAITALRDVIHAHSWSPHLSAELAEFSPRIFASNAIACATFNTISRDIGLRNGEDIFAQEKDHQKSLSEVDLGELNTSKDALIKAPNIVSAIKLMEALMVEVLDEVHKRRCTRTPA